MKAEYWQNPVCTNRVIVGSCMTTVVYILRTLYKLVCNSHYKSIHCSKYDSFRIQLIRLVKIASVVSIVVTALRLDQCRSHIQYNVRRTNVQYASTLIVFLLLFFLINFTHCSLLINFILFFRAMILDHLIYGIILLFFRKGNNSTMKETRMFIRSSQFTRYNYLKTVYI